jgi:hypothetical protein
MENNFDNLIKSIEQINQLQQVAVENTLQICKPEVNDIVRLNIKNSTLIEHTLDMLLEVAFDDQILELFRKLCRHYYLIDPQSTAFYVHSYREMWDTDENIPSAQNG